MRRVMIGLIALSSVFLVPEPSLGRTPVDLQKSLTGIFASVVYSSKLKTSVHEEDITSRQAVDSDLILNLESGSSAVQSYFPMHNGDSKSYSWSIYNSTLSYSNTVYNGRNVYLEVDTLDGSKTYYGYSDDKLFMYGGEVEELNMKFSTPLQILNNNVLNKGGTIKSSTSFLFEGFTVLIDYEATVEIISDVTVPVATFNDCRSISMEFRLQVVGESESLVIKDAWKLAPDVGKIQVAVFDQFFRLRGWAGLTSGTVNGVDVADLAIQLTAGFIAKPTFGTVPLLVNFSDQSKGNVTSWVWDFGDGSTSTAQDPTHIYNDPGAYTVSLTVAGARGSDIETKTDYINVRTAAKAMPWIPLLLDD